MHISVYFLYGDWLLFTVSFVSVVSYLFGYIMNRQKICTIYVFLFVFLKIFLYKRTCLSFLSSDYHILYYMKTLTKPNSEKSFRMFLGLSSVATVRLFHAHMQYDYTERRKIVNISSQLLLQWIQESWAAKIYRCL